MPARGKSRRVLPLSKSRDERFQRSGSYRDAASRAREVPFVARKQLKRSQQNQRRARAIPVRSGAAFSRRPLARIVPRGHAPRLALSEHGLAHAFLAGGGEFGELACGVVHGLA